MSCSCSSHLTKCDDQYERVRRAPWSWWTLAGFLAFGALVRFTAYEETAHARDGVVKVVEKGSPQAEIVISRRATTVERRAVEELRRYIRAMTKCTLPVLTTPSPSARTLILVGRAETHPLIARLVGQKKIALSKTSPGGDGFVIKRVAEGSKTFLVLGGSSERGVLYAVYELLSRWGVGFFWDGEFIPRRDSLNVPALDLVERPRFRIRQYLQGCAFSYSTPHWGLEEWKREMRWAAWHRQNRVMLPLPSITKGAYRRMGIDVGDYTPTERERIKLFQQVVRYARSLGI